MTWTLFHILSFCLKSYVLLSCANPDKNEGCQPTFETLWHTEILVIRKHPNSSFNIISIENLPGYQLNARYYLPLVFPAYLSILIICCHDFFLQGRKSTYCTVISCLKCNSSAHTLVTDNYIFSFMWIMFI